MNAIETSNRRKGRPSTTLSDRLRVSYWSHWVMHASGCEEAKAFELLLRKQHRISMASGLWSRYLRGEVLPQSALSHARPSFVGRLERIYPGSAAVFAHPVWSLLLWGDQVDFRSMRDLYLWMGEDISIHFCARIQDRCNRVHSNDVAFWYLQRNNDSRRQIVASIPDPFLQIMVCLLEGRMAYAGQRITSFVDSYLLAARTAGKLGAVASTQPAHIQNLFLTMEALCLEPAYLEVVKSSPAGPLHETSRATVESGVLGWQRRVVRHMWTLGPRARQSFVGRLKRELNVGRAADLLVRMEQWREC